MSNTPRIIDSFSYSFLDTLHETIYEIYQDGQLYATAWYCGLMGGFHMFIDGNLRHYLKNLTDYSFAQTRFYVQY